MRALRRSSVAVVVLATTMVIWSVAAGSRPAAAVEVGQPAPDFNLASTNGIDISLSSFKDKKWVFLEFYAVDFSPA